MNRKEMVIIGLDNGIVIRHKEGKVIFIPKKCYEDKYLFDDNPHYEIAYWRKCWGIRNEIIRMFADESLYDSYDIVLDRDDIKKLISLMKKFTKRVYWDEHADSLWTYDEFKNRQKRIVKNLKWLYWYMRKDPEVEAYFYDSY